MKETWRKMEKWMKIELMLMVAFGLSGVIMAGVLGKLQGMLFALSTISIFVMIRRSSGIFLPLARIMTTSVKYEILILISAFYIVALALYGQISNEAWVMINIFIEFVSGIFVSAFFIDYDVILKDLTSTKMFSEMQYLERMVFAATGILGGFLSFLMAENMNIKEIVMVVLQIEAIAIMFMLSQYLFVYKDLDVKDDEKDKDKESSIYLKKTLEEYQKGL